MSWAPEVRVFGDDKWYRNQLRFATIEEAECNADDLAIRWTAVYEARAAESPDPVTHRWTGRESVPCRGENDANQDA